MAGAVLYLERSDGVAVGLLKVKSLLVSRSIFGGACKFSLDFGRFPFMKLIAAF